MAFLRRVKPKMAAFTVGIRIMPDTPLAETAIREGIISSQSDLIEPTFYIAPEIEPWIDERIRKEYRRHSEWIVNGTIFSVMQWLKRLRWKLRARAGRDRAFPLGEKS